MLQQTAESYAARLLLRLEEEDQITALGAERALELRRRSIVHAEGTALLLDPRGLAPAEWSPTAMGQLTSLHSDAEDLERPRARGTHEKRRSSFVVLAGAWS